MSTAGLLCLHSVFFLFFFFFFFFFFVFLVLFLFFFFFFFFFVFFFFFFFLMFAIERDVVEGIRSDSSKDIQRDRRQPRLGVRCARLAQTTAFS